MLLLAIFVVGSIVFSIWAWRNYDAASQKELVGQDDPGPLVIVTVIALVGGCLPEILRHYTKLPSALRIGLSVAVIAVAQYLAFRVLNRIRRKSRTGESPVTTQALPQS
jgi:UPF0716 family protein affecting phage T7 exclusion